jgi:hypothetical protein
MKKHFLKFWGCFILLAGMAVSGRAQDILGNLAGTALDSSGAVVAGADVKAQNIATNLEVSATTNEKGEYHFYGLPIGTYKVSFSKSGFETEIHTQILVQGNRTTTLDGKLSPGKVSESIEVTATPLLNQVDTTNGYVLGEQVIQSTPLGTGSFTQLAILSPGVNADFLGTSGTNAGLGNQSIWANGQRDTSNSFTFNGVNANNIFNAEECPVNPISLGKGG